MMIFEHGSEKTNIQEKSRAEVFFEIFLHTCEEDSSTIRYEKSLAHLRELERAGVISYKGGDK